MSLPQVAAEARSGAVHLLADRRHPARTTLWGVSPRSVPIEPIGDEEERDNLTAKVQGHSAGQLRPLLVPTPAGGDCGTCGSCGSLQVAERPVVQMASIQAPWAGTAVAAAGQFSHLPQ